MHLQTHIMSGWCVGNVLPLNPRERLFCMMAAALADVDGISYVFGQETYWKYHHALGHNVTLGVLLAATMTAFSKRRLLVFPLYLALFHLHLVMDYYGSGPGWPLYYLWPWSQWKVVNHTTWEFYSWQNIGTAAALLVWTIAIAWRCRRTPLEVFMPGLDRQLVALLPERRPRPGDEPVAQMEKADSR
jgi:hypothetical protein